MSTEIQALEAGQVDPAKHFDRLYVVASQDDLLECGEPDVGQLQQQPSLIVPG